MADIPTFVALGTIRCFHRGDSDDRTACGISARYMRLAPGAHLPEFYCERHFAITDHPIAGQQLVRRVSIAADVIFCGTSFNPTLAQAEAVRLLEAAVERAGGVINLHAATSQVGRWTVPGGYLETVPSRPRG